MISEEQWSTVLAKTDESLVDRLLAAPRGNSCFGVSCELNIVNGVEYSCPVQVLSDLLGHGDISSIALAVEGTEHLDSKGTIMAYATEVKRRLHSGPSLVVGNGYASVFAAMRS